MHDIVNNNYTYLLWSLSSLHDNIILIKKISQISEGLQRTTSWLIHNKRVLQI